MRNDNTVKTDRRKISFRLGEYVSNSGEIFKITQIINFNELVGISIKTGQASRLLIKNLKLVETPSTDKFDNQFIHRDIEEISDLDWKEIEKRFNDIQPILLGATKEDVILHGQTIGIHFTTLYRWARKYRATGTMTGLLPKKKGRPIGALQIDPRSEHVMEQLIKNTYLKDRFVTVDKLIQLINTECKNKNLEAPSPSTIRRRINDCSEEERLKRINKRAEAKTKLSPAPNQYVSDYPLQVVQIDHTPVDLILVDDEYRLPIGKPYITLAIDVFSRMIVGYYLSLEPPSTTSIAMCIANAINPKDEWLIIQGVESTWPVWGFMDTVHADNGAEFRSKTLQKACLTHEINLEFRPVKSPNFGGHIERLIGTVMKKVHSIPGTTFSNIEERAEYDSEGNAIMTFEEFEKWLLTWITKLYHKSKHSALGMSPEHKWNEGIFGSLHSEGVGYLPKPNDSETVFIDFLPLSKRTIQRNGINLDGLNYYDNVLRPFIRQVDSETNKAKKFIVKRDPRDVSFVWFYHSDLQQYYKIPLANQAIPNMTLWELKAIKKRLSDQHLEFSEHNLIMAHEELREIINSSSKKTKRARRMNQRLKNLEKTMIDNVVSINKKNESPPTQENDGLWDDDIPVFD